MDDSFEYNDFDEINDLIKRFETNLNTNSPLFFDIEDMEDIIDYYDDLHDLNMLEKAINSASELYPNHIYFKLKKAQKLTYDDKLTKAKDLVNQVLRTEPTNVLAKLTLSTIYSKMGESNKSIPLLLEALELGADPIDVWYNISWEYQSLGKYEMAISYLKKILGEFPDEEVALHDLQFCYELSQNNEGCIEFLQGFVEEHPYNADAWFNLGIAFSNLSLYEKSIDAYEFAIAADDDYSSAHFNMANSYYNLANFAKAVEYYKEAINIDGEDTMILTYLAQCYEQMGEYDIALLNLFNAVKLDEQNTSAWLKISIIYHKQDKLAKSLEFIRKAVELNPENEGISLFLIGILLDNELYDEAIKVSEKMLLTSSKSMELWSLYSDCYMLQDDFAKSIDIINESKKHLDENYLMTLKEAEVNLYLGKLKEARLLIYRALELDKANTLLEIENNEDIMNEASDFLDDFIANT